MFIVCGGVNYFFRVHGKSQTFILLFPYFLYPISYIGMTGSTLMTIAVSFERFLGILFPLQCTKNVRKSWFYILPVIAISILVNSSKYLELTLVQTENGKWTYNITQLRRSNKYIKYYRTYFLISFAGVLPL